MDEAFVIYGLRETYHEQGTFEFKVVLGPRQFKSSHGSSVRVVDSDRKPVSVDIKRWGRKMICTFVIDEDVADGVATVELDLTTTRGTRSIVRKTFWVIK